MALPAKSREVAVEFATKTFVRPMMGLQHMTLRYGVGAEAALESRRFELTQSDRVEAPSRARKVFAIFHYLPPGARLDSATAFDRGWSGSTLMRENLRASRFLTTANQDAAIA